MIKDLLLFLLGALKPSRKTLMLGLLFAVGVCGLFYLFNMLNAPEEILFTEAPEGELNYGLEEELDPGTLTEYYSALTGNLYFNITSLDTYNKITGINVHKHNLNTSKTVPMIAEGAQFNLRPVSATSVTLVSPLLNADGSVTPTPVVLDTVTLNYKDVVLLDGYITRDVLFSPDERYLAVSFVDEQDREVFKNWRIVVFDTTTDTSILIPGAKSPRWLSDNTGFVFLQEDGVYQYVTEVNGAHVVYAEYQFMHTTAEIALSPDDTRIVLTQPLFDSISVLEATSTQQTAFHETGRIQTKGQHYTTPVFSPDGNFYATVASNNFDYDSQENLYEANTIEIRRVLHRNVIEVISLLDYKKGVLQLSDWSTIDATTVGR
ncbi:MAG: WD40 repeat protein [Patiriisocius sp.]|jgi:WD40 repeat protein